MYPVWVLVNSTPNSSLLGVPKLYAPIMKPPFDQVPPVIVSYTVAASAQRGAITEARAVKINKADIFVLMTVS